MTTQERINQLAFAALQETPTPPLPHEPAPVTGEAAPQASAKPFVFTAAPMPVSPVATTTTPAPFETKAEADMRTLIDERERRLGRRRSLQSKLVTALVLSALAATGFWYAKSPEAQGWMQNLIPALKQSGKDLKMAASTEQYDKQLEKVAVRSDQIDEATRALGVDPKSVGEKDDLYLEKETREFMGENAPTTADRDRALRSTFGIVGKLRGNKEAPQDPKAGAKPAASSDAGSR